MKGILTFNLPEDDDEFRTSQNGHIYRLILFDLDEHLRMVVKHSDKPENEKKVYAEIREVLVDMARDYKVEI